MRLSELKVYHGTPCKPKGPLRPPIFVTTDAENGADWYTQHEDTGVILYGELNIKHPLDARGPEGFDKMLAIARSAGIDIITEPYFECSEISKHCDNDGTNSSDLVYIPAFVKAVKKEGYDSIHIYDVMTNYEIDTYVLFDAKQFKIEGTLPS